MFRSMRWRIAIPYVALILVATLGLTLYLSSEVRQARLADLEAQLLADARLLSDEVGPVLQAGVDGDTLDAAAQHWSELLGARVTIIGADGTVLGDSHTDRAQMDNHLQRPEVQEALASGEGSSIRFSRTMGYEMMYGAVPVADAGEPTPLGIVRVSYSLSQINAGISSLRNSIAAAGIATALVATLISILIAGHIARPIRDLTEAAERLAHGDLSARLVPSTYDETGALARSFNDMAGQLREQVTTLAEERQRLETVLGHMSGGVLIADTKGHVQLINDAAARLFDSTEVEAMGRSFAQVVPHHQLIELLQRSQEKNEEQVEMVEISHHDLFLEATITPFHEGDSVGYLVMLQDLTRIRRLETVRRDFISNISHELRTPLAGLKALVDTLLGGAIKDRPAARRFLRRMEGELDALNQMVEELLELSRVESGKAPLHLSPTNVADVVIAPADRLRPQAARAGLDLTVDLHADLPQVLADLERAQLVVTNLVHNAVKFTPPGGSVVISARPDGDEVLISVSDTGVGIPADDLARIFERFYKADRARSGGGTGLGLAIAKHIVQGHGGRIWAESVEGEGSTFTFTLPAVTTD